MEINGIKTENAVEEYLKDVLEQLGDEPEDNDEAWVELPDGRSIEVIVNKVHQISWYDTQLHCSGDKFDKNSFYNTMGVIESYSTGTMETEELRQAFKHLLLRDSSIPIGNGRMATQKHIVINTSNFYLHCYFRAKGLHPGDALAPYEYMAWVDSKHDKFREKLRIPEHKRYNNEEAKLFDDFLAEEAETENASA